MTTELPAALITRGADFLERELDGRPAGHCIRIDDLTRDDAIAIATELAPRIPGVDVHVLAESLAEHPAEIAADRAIELRNRKVKPLLLLIPAKAGLSASSLDNSFEPLPLVEMLDSVSGGIEEELASSPVGPLVATLRRVLGRARKAESWARYLGTLWTDPELSTAGRELWQVGLVPDLGENDADSRLRRNAKAVAAIARPSRPTARVIDRLLAADVAGGAFRQRLQVFLEQQPAGILADPARWTKAIGRQRPGDLTFERWPAASVPSADLTRVKVASFLKPNGKIDPQSKLKLEEDGLPYCEVGEDQPGKVSVKWTTTPATPSAVGSWRAEMLPPPDIRTPDTTPVARTTVKADKRRVALQVAVGEEDLAENGTLYVLRVLPLDTDGNEITLDEEVAAEAESDQFQVKFGEVSPPGLPRKATSSLPLAVLTAAVEVGGDLEEETPSWDQDGQVFSIRIGRRVALVRASRMLRHLQQVMTGAPGEPMAFTASSPLGEPIPDEEVRPVPLTLPAALADRRRRLLTTLASGPRQGAIEIVNWNDGDLREQARSYAQSYRRALTADPDALPDLLKLDTLSVRVATSAKDVTGLVLLPTHPLRLAWTAAHDQTLRDWARQVATGGRSKAVREQQVDLSLVSRLSPANMPFIVPSHDGEPLVYAEELTHGAALYLPPDTTEPESVADVICRAIGIGRANGELSVTAQTLTDRFRSYRMAHPGTGPMRLMGVNPGTGALLERSLHDLALGREADADDSSIPPDPQRLEVIAYTYADRRSYTDPVSELRGLQRAIAAGEARRKAPTHLTPALGLAVRDLEAIQTDREGHHLAVVQDITSSRVTGPESDDSVRDGTTATFRDLLTPLIPERARDGSPRWYVTPALRPRGSGTPESEIIGAHQAHQAAVAARLGLPQGVPALEVSLAPDDRDRYEAAHERADWVITLDRGIGPEIFEGAGPTWAAKTRYLLDYTPDFLEGLGKKLTVTTVHHDEVRRVLGKAMQDLDITQDEASVSRVLNHLSLVSGRLALRLLRDTSLSIEAASLAAVMAHLHRRGQLTDRIVIPVDAHAEIFGVHQRPGETPARRCDLLLVQVTERTLRIECIEVKGRRTADLPAGLADAIVDQLELTERLLQHRFFATHPERIDAPLQRARLSGLLHYYADRSARFGHIDQARLAEIHRNIDRLGESAAPKITKRGYVIAYDKESFPATHREVPIQVLTPASLGEAGFTTVSGALETPPQTPEEPTSADMPTVMPLAPAPTPAPEETVLRPTTAPHPRASVGKAAERSIPEEAVRPPAEDDAMSEGTDSTSEDEAPTGPPAEGGTLEDESQAGEAPEKDSARARYPSVVSVELGLDAGNAPVTWNVSTKGSPHAFILGIPGQGKSVTTRRIIREFASQSLPSLVLDFHGDMAADPPVGAQVIDATQGLQFSPFELSSTDEMAVKTTAYEVAEIVSYVCGLGEIQRNHVYKGLQQAYRSAGGMPSMKQFADAVEESEREGKGGQNARARIQPLTDFGLFADDPSGAFLDSWDSGAVIDLSNLRLETVQLAAGAFILRKVYREMFRWDLEGVLRLAIVLDEAHRLAKDVTLPKLMKEGRKYGVSVVVASQGMADFHRDVIGNAGTKIVFRTNYPESKPTAGFLRNRDAQDLSQQIEQLTVGVAYVSTPDHPNARRVYMHQ
jgi:DNA phosphorothioation-dependent restriction protein DptH